MKVKNVIFCILDVFFLAGLSLLLFSIVEFYDLESFLYTGVPTLLFIFLFGLSFRDNIAKNRHDQVLIANFISIIVFVGILIGSYFLFTSVLKTLDIFKLAIEQFNITFLMNYIK